MKYKTELYPVTDLAKTAMIDFAMESWASEVYKFHANVVYIAFGAPLATQHYYKHTKYMRALCCQASSRQRRVTIRTSATRPTTVRSNSG